MCIVWLADLPPCANPLGMPRHPATTRAMWGCAAGPSTAPGPNRDLRQPLQAHLRQLSRMALRMAGKAPMGSVWAAPRGSGIFSSICWQGEARIGNMRMSADGWMVCEH